MRTISNDEKEVPSNVQELNAVAADRSPRKDGSKQASKAKTKQNSKSEEQKLLEDAPAWQRMTFPVLEQFFWRRIIMDEFHELEALQRDQRESLHFLRAHHR